MYVRHTVLRDPHGTDASKYHDREGENKTPSEVARSEAPERKCTEGKQTFQQDRVPDDKGRFIRAGLADHETSRERNVAEYHRFEA
mmetsp:Transcript_4205/g.8737  ORF Transcript_4205/g.8737 Transcript_4205/m.8737 type:complete len:86 (-) Transcript_4205:871-1128(-)